MTDTQPTPEWLCDTIGAIIKSRDDDVKFYQAIKALGVIRHDSCYRWKSKEIMLSECVRNAFLEAAEMYSNNIHYPPPPTPDKDYLTALQQITIWCVEASRAKPGKPAENQPHETQGEENPITEFKIKKTDFNNGKSKKLLMDLAKQPDCVWYNENLHGKKQPGTLKEMLKRNGKYDAIIDKIHQDQKDSQLKIYLDKDFRIILT